ncbi:hypothetical protein FISHEDRAFT_61351 [Fistulina hepatica ATCC 64428]|uniref:Uncharacterized protein n=1 Tax=Fistulina hepatica ATCC 64428 TaxID=1128425 RepID=A0A0D7A356_9AGAR|nr:hypothetical protein FISHEDRAFT_61351 [Fistulina hepatica ATCC 64428]
MNTDATTLVNADGPSVLASTDSDSITTRSGRGRGRGRGHGCGGTRGHGNATRGQVKARASAAAASCKVDYMLKHPSVTSGAYATYWKALKGTEEEKLWLKRADDVRAAQEQLFLHRANGNAHRLQRDSTRRTMASACSVTVGTHRTAASALGAHRHTVSAALHPWAIKYLDLHAVSP